MTTQEFSDQFDVLYNNIMSNQAPGLDEYEKSVFLTKAQYEIVKNYFNPKSNKNQEGFDDSPKRQVDFSKLMAVKTPVAFTTADYPKFDDRSQLFTMPADILFVLNETAVNFTPVLPLTEPPVAQGGTERLINIIPISFEEYARIISKPYKQPLKNQGWRLFNGGDISTTTHFVTEIIIKSGTLIKDYRVRYVKRPKPIILTTLSETNVSLDGLTVITECELDPILHPEILQRAVELAKSAYTGDLKSSVDLGQRNE